MTEPDYHQFFQRVLSEPPRPLIIKKEDIIGLRS